MMKKILGSAIAVAMTASVASAGYIPGQLDRNVFGGLGNPGNGPFVAANSKLFKNAQKASKEGAKLAGGVAKCYSKGAGNVSKGKADGVAACIAKAHGKYNDKITGIAGKAPGLPACNNSINSGSAILVLVKSFQAGLYCASPSGAFVDSASF